ncbi:MAG: hypothetical protein AABZ53_04495 [Planctomycetota bacterium]
MGQFGMQMPGGRARGGSSLDMFSVMAFLSFVALAAGCVAMYLAAVKLSPDGSPFALQDTGKDKIKFTPSK